MSYEDSGTLLDYAFCRYGTSKAKFRGPEVEIGNQTVAFVGASETFGRFSISPFPAIVEHISQRPCANFGQNGAGIDGFILDRDVQNMCQRSAITVVQIMGAQNMSNRLYSVHPRRNDRFIRQSMLMKTIFDDIEFTDFNFVQHMLSTIKNQAPDRFPIIVQELKAAWVARMKMMLAQIGGQIILLWVPCKASPSNVLGTGPLFVDEAMIAELAPAVCGVIRPKMSTDPNDPSTDGLLYSPFDQAAAALAMSQAEHQYVAELLAAELK